MAVRKLLINCGEILPSVCCGVYNQSMKLARRYDWRVTTARAREIQTELAQEVSRAGKVAGPGLIAGVDVSVNRFARAGSAAVVVLRYPAMEIVETALTAEPIEFPYVPGLLTFREAPLILAAFEKLAVTPDLVMVDGQGIAHPRRIGLASHLGLCLGIPAIGCAKSRLIGQYEEPGSGAGSCSELKDNGEVIGAVVRTRSDVKPVYVSIGHLIDLSSAVQCVLACCRGYRLPEPTRRAHMAAGGNLDMRNNRVNLAEIPVKGL
jgi:deoxyribonuclease V